MTRLPSVLTTEHLPLAELHALRLDGVLFALDRSFAAIDQPISPETRAAALAPELNERMIAERETAAWIWGALDQPPSRHQFSTEIGARMTHRADAWFAVREVVIAPAEIYRISEISVTTPQRTIIDLARFADNWDTRIATAVDRLLRLGTITNSDLRQSLNRPKLSHKLRALKRLGLG